MDLLTIICIAYSFGMTISFIYIHLKKIVILIYPFCKKAFFFILPHLKDLIIFIYICFKNITIFTYYFVKKTFLFLLPHLKDLIIFILIKSFKLISFLFTLFINFLKNYFNKS